MSAADTGQAQAREGLPFVPDEMWLTADWGVIESDGAGAWRTIENALPVEQLPAVRLRLIPAVDEQGAGSPSADTGQAPDEAALPGFLQMQDAIEGALRGAGHDLADMADVVYVATEAVRGLLGTDTTTDGAS